MVEEAAVSGKICEYCNQDPCDCPVFDLPDEDEVPDDPADCDADEGPEEPDL